MKYITSRDSENAADYRCRQVPDGNFPVARSQRRMKSWSSLDSHWAGTKHVLSKQRGVQKVYPQCTVAK